MKATGNGASSRRPRTGGRCRLPATALRPLLSFSFLSFSRPLPLSSPLPLLYFAVSLPLFSFLFRFLACGFLFRFVFSLVSYTSFFSTRLSLLSSASSSGLWLPLPLRLFSVVLRVLFSLLVFRFSLPAPRHFLNTKDGRGSGGSVPPRVDGPGSVPIPRNGPRFVPSPWDETV